MQHFFHINEVGAAVSRTCPLHKETLDPPPANQDLLSYLSARILSPDWMFHPACSYLIIVSSQEVESDGGPMNDGFTFQRVNV